MVSPQAVVVAPDISSAAGLGPWNPGIESNLPRAFLPLATVFRDENVETRIADAREMSDVCGLPLTQLVRFRPERLVIHEVLIRVMADLSVPVGQTYGDLGVNFRAIVATILRDGIAAHQDEIAALLDRTRNEAAALLARAIAEMLSGPLPAMPDRPWTWRSLLGASAPAVRSTACAEPEAHALHHLEAWQHSATESGDALAMACCAALTSVVSAMLGRRGFLIRDEALLASLAGTLVSNQYGSSRIGALIEPWFREVVAREGFRSLPGQTHPVVMNVKGSSASGKSTIRPYQRDLVGEIGLDWSDFALITPDVWRKFLLDYDSLGPARRYAGTLTGHEIEIVDRKLDRHMAQKASEGRISHLLIDRFRFDSFAVDPGAATGSHLLTRFGHRVYMQFMITPPDATVERAWKRGEQFGRYKAVEDLLAHNVEAYTGMPRLFFTWVLRTDKDVHFEFLDNSVPEGQRPRTIAFGINGVMNILDLKFVFDIDRYRKIDINAHTPEQVYADTASTLPEANMDFLRACLRRMTTVRFADHATGRVYARFDRGHLTSLDPATLGLAQVEPDIGAALIAMGIRGTTPTVPDSNESLRPAEAQTLGSWGEGAPA
ncbi:hypothetical protein G3T14_11060 [Methylobacterium sp. BTF04]|nr:hypothetical protein [Methylobacterium sp. BTF04]